MKHYAAKCTSCGLLWRLVGFKPIAILHYFIGAILGIWWLECPSGSGRHPRMTFVEIPEEPQ